MAERGRHHPLDGRTMEDPSKARLTSSAWVGGDDRMVRMANALMGSKKPQPTDADALAKARAKGRVTIRRFTFED